MANIKKKKEGYANIGRKRGAGATKSNTKNDIAWAYFTSKTIQTVLFFWVFFPFWSYQLQLIVDQGSCEAPATDADRVPGSAKYGCPLPYIEYSDSVPIPYAPTLYEQPHVKPVAIIATIDHKFDSMVSWVGRKLRAGLNLFVKLVGKGDCAGSGGPGRLAQGLGPEAALAAKNPEMALATKMVGGAAPQGETKDFNYDAWHVMERELTKQFKSGIPPPQAPKARVWASGLAKALGEGACCKDLKKALDPNGEARCPEKKEPTSFFGKLFDLSRFGWPYTYIYDDPKDIMTYRNSEGKVVTGPRPTAYNPIGKSAVNGWGTWMGAWLAETQLKAWSRNRWLMHICLKLFLGPIHRPLTRDMVAQHYNNMIGDIMGLLKKVDKILDPAPGIPVSAADRKKYGAIKVGLEGYKEILGSNKKKFWDSCRAGCDIKGVLLEVLKPHIMAERSAIDKFQKARGGKGQAPTPFFLDFFITALKPTSLRTYGAHMVWWKWCEPFIGSGKGVKFWGRYFVTLIMPMLASIQFYAAIPLSAIQTVLGYFNRFSIFWLPILFFMFPIPIFWNMFAQPLELIYYWIVGPFGARRNSADCPFTGGLHQMKENMHAYGPLNFFLTLASIVTALGATLLRTKTGPPALGATLAGIFPLLIFARIAWGALRIGWDFYQSLK